MSSSIKKQIMFVERLETYKDFSLNLLYYIDHYYIDYESLSDDVDIKNHFNWCFNKVCDNFKKEGIDFSDNEKLKNYFYDFYYHQYYKTKGDKKYNITIDFYRKFFEELFNIETVKGVNYTILINLYSIFDETFKKEKNVVNIT